MSASHDPAGPSVASVLVLYTLARLGLLVVIAGVLVAAGTPLVIAALVALVVALPLSMVLFRGLRARLEVALATTRERRATQRAALRAGLRGDASGDGAEGEPDGRGGRPDQQEQPRLAEHADEPPPVGTTEHLPGDGDRER